MPLLALLALAGAGLGLGGWGLSEALDSVDRIVLDTIPLIGVATVGAVVFFAVRK